MYTVHSIAPTIPQFVPSTQLGCPVSIRFYSLFPLVQSMVTQWHNWGNINRYIYIYTTYIISHIIWGKQISTTHFLWMTSRCLLRFLFSAASGLPPRGWICRPVGPKLKRQWRQAWSLNYRNVVRNYQVLLREELVFNGIIRIEQRYKVHPPVTKRHNWTSTLKVDDFASS